MLSTYRSLAATPSLPSLLGWALVGRLHMPAMPIALTFLVAGWTGSYAIAGTVVAALTVGGAIAGPVRGRMADRKAASRVLLVAGSCYAAGLAVLAALPAWAWPASLVVAFLTGLCMPPVPQIARSTWPRIASGAVRQTLYTAEATLQELLFIVGPILAAATVAVVDARAATALSAAVALVGSAGFATAVRRAGLDLPARAPEAAAGSGLGGRGALLAGRGLVAVAAVHLTLIAALGAVDLVIVAWSRNVGQPAMAGVLAAVWAFGSLLGGAVASTFTRPPRFRLRVLCTWLGISAAIPVLPPVLDPSSVWLIGAVLFVGGAAIAPTIAAAMAKVSGLAPVTRRGEAFGWLSTAATAGIALSSPITGFVLDRYGPAAGVGAAAALSATAVLLSLSVPRTVPRSTGG